MFCPNCKTEYRPGFAKCTDCGTDLVEHLLSENLDVKGEVPTDPAGRQLLWSGLSTKLQEAICDALDSAKIAHKETEKGFGLLPTMAQSASFIWVDSPDRVAARSIVDKLFANPKLDEPVDEEVIAETGVNPFRFNQRVFHRAQAEESAENEDALPEPEDSNESDGASVPAPDDLAEDPRPEDATWEVWSGEDAELADYLALCLRGVGVGCVLREDEGKSRVMVLPEAEKRAREVIREVVDAEPPQ
jgi:hypothetical protein